MDSMTIIFNAYIYRECFQLPVKWHRKNKEKCLFKKFVIEEVGGNIYTEVIPRSRFVNNRISNEI